LVIACPEYAHGIPGSFKNALDWLVGSVEFPGKPVAVFSPSARSAHAQAQLREVLTTMSARLVGDGPFVVPLATREMDAAAIVADRELSSRLCAVLAEIVGMIRGLR
jgi:NAD(P)H-dependent FMN reductase